MVVVCWEALTFLMGSREEGSSRNEVNKSGVFRLNFFNRLYSCRLWMISEYFWVKMILDKIPFWLSIAFLLCMLKILALYSSDYLSSSDLVIRISWLLKIDNFDKIDIFTSWVIFEACHAQFKVGNAVLYFSP